MSETNPPQDNRLFQDIPAVPNLVSEQNQKPNDSAAEKEAAAIASGTLEDEAAKAEHGRNEKLRDLIHTSALYVVTLVAFLFALTVVILAWHFFAPERFCWLSKEQLATIKTVVFSGALSSAAGGYLSRRLR